MKRAVITGMGIVSPLGNSISAFWNALRIGTNGIAPITRFDTERFKVKLAAEVRDFDPSDWMSKSEIAHSDLFTQFAIAAACQAVEESGVLDSVAPERIGVYMGSGIGGIATFMAEHRKLMESPRRVSPYFIPMMIPNMAAAMIAMRFHCHGAALPAVSACASGSNAIGEALRVIRHGYADVMIAGGCEATVNELAAAGFSSMQALSFSDSPNQASLPFDRKRKGFVMGEGAGALIVEEYEHAVARGAHIYAELCGYGSTCDASHMTAPDPDGTYAAAAIRQAWNEAGLQGESVYVNAHGTGTVLNDKIETLAIKRALGEETARRLHISSTKSMTGHMLGAAGAAEAIACVMALNHDIVPPTINLTEPDPACDLDYTPGTARNVPLDAAISNSLGFGGHNACLAFRKAGM